MIWRTLAEHPGSPPVLLSAITAAVLRSPAPDPRTLAAVMTHPATDATDLTRLIATGLPAEAVCAAAARETIPAALHTQLTDPVRRGHLITDLATATASQLSAVVGLAAAEPDCRHVVVPAVLSAPSATPAHATTLACTLARDPQPIPEVRTWLASLLARIPAGQAAALASTLATECPNPAVAADLRQAVEAAHARARLRDLLVAGAQADGDEDAWVVTVRAFGDLDGTLSQAAMGAHPSRRVWSAVANDTHVPPKVRLVALEKTLAVGGSTWDLPVGELVAMASPAQLAGLAAAADGWPLLRAVTAHPHVTADALDTAWATCTRLDSAPDAAVCLTFATHPNASPALAKAALHAARTARTSSETTTAVTACAQTLATHPHADVSAVLPAACLTTWPTGEVGHAPGVRAWVHRALSAQLPRITTREGAEALLALAPAFTGSVRELVDVTVTIG